MYSGIELGSGAFGRVVKADAVGLRPDQPVTTVAVKMVRSQLNSTTSAIESLISEMKIMHHLGSHLNVVNLLGACTKRISKGEFLILVEYCRFGNLGTFLRERRELFVNLVDSVGALTFQIDLSAVPEGYIDMDGYVYNNAIIQY